MRTIVHLSDLHFGALDERLLPPLHDALSAAEPDLVAVSGDLTQRARRREFEAARAFLAALNCPALVVPGNHDVPFYNVAARFLNPTRRYRRYITGGLAPVFADDEMVVVGLNSARRVALRGGGGRLNRRQVEAAASRLAAAPPGAVKIVVTHHPFDVPPGRLKIHLIGGAKMAMARLAASGADVFLAGHLHTSHIGHTADRYRIAGHSALAIQAGTISRRGRGEANAFNVLRIDGGLLTVDRHAWQRAEGEFAVAFSNTFERVRGSWRSRRLRG
jgi:3',5'-cyclic AMP phosphodiesterase CpdA